MEVILLKNVENLGSLGDKVSVKAGFGRNYLIPSGNAVPATDDNLAAFEARRAELENAAAEALEVATGRKDRLEALPSITIVCKAGDEGRLFGSVGTTDIAVAVSEAGVEVEKHEVRLTQGAFRVAGEYDVELHLHADVKAVVKVEVVPEE
jgi:large subunit ribosomal protein L9